VDPPRKGLDKEVLDALCNGPSNSNAGGRRKTQKKSYQRPTGHPFPAPGCLSSGSKLVYISCGFKAFQRDTSCLLANGRWRLIFAEGHVLFPGADHVETVAIFENR
jgi:tRNA/tmRNA/rRNA uracil-C5-methylase (TrmA/RlmC/RlmD family)